MKQSLSNCREQNARSGQKPESIERSRRDKPKTRERFCPVFDWTHDAEEVPIGGADVNLRLDQRLPLLDERAELVAGEVHSVEVGEHGSPLNILAAQLHLPVPLDNERNNGKNNAGARQGEGCGGRSEGRKRTNALTQMGPIGDGWARFLIKISSAVHGCRAVSNTPPSRCARETLSSPDCNFRSSAGVRFKATR